MEQFNDDDYCFVCGTQNPLGLKMEFFYNAENDEMVADTNFARHFQGWQGVLHGGLVSTVLDEVMVKAAARKGLKCVTAELNVRFKKPALLKNRFTIKGKITGVNRRLISAEGSIVDPDNITIATAAGKFLVID